MKAVILAAGRGTRMKELTQARPKPMLVVQGRPILEHILLGLQAAGIEEVFVVTGFRAEAIEDYFGDGRRWGLRLQYGRQVVQDGTGKAPEVAREFVGESAFLLTYGDILVRPETYQQMRARFGGGAYDGLITVTAGEDVSKGAVVVVDERFDFVTLVEKPTRAQLEELRGRGLLREGGPYWYNAGIYIFRPCLFAYTARLEKSPRGEYELTDAITAMAAAGHRLAGLAIAGRWVDVRDPEVLARLEREAEAGRGG
ncbi:MAG: sugar phosphate nucleotidyltransferase [Verrucomicrobiae bacterium]|nr:sugar phosphate nucleotidyltransferase [Verrucomicrobiae bacterium]